ncbi:hypothetical protein MASR2M78_02840 [Treponema sp.]
MAVLLVLARVKTLVATRRGNPGDRSLALKMGTRRMGIAFLAALSLAMLFPYLYVFSRELVLALPLKNVDLKLLVHDWTSVKNSLLLSLFVVPPMLVFGVFIANAVKSRRHKILLTGLILVPAVLPGVLLGFGLLRSLHAIEATQHSSSLLVIILGVALIVRGLPYVVIVLQSAINAGTIPLEDSARSLGASPGTAFITVTLPQIRPVIAIAAVVGVFTCVTELSASLIIYPPGWQTMSMFIAYYMEEGFVRRAIFMAFILLVLVESILVFSGLLSARSSGMIKGGGAISRDRMVFLSAFTALEQEEFKSGRGRKRYPIIFVFWIRFSKDAFSRLSRFLTGFSLPRLPRWVQGRDLEILRLRAENASLRKELIKASHRNLSMQINPHFFFNTLNTLVSLVQKDQDAAIGTIGKLSSLFRYALDASESDTLPLAKEIEYIRTYLEIEKMRFGDKLHYTLLIPDQFFHIWIPPLLIQPLLENAIKYGKDAQGKTYLFLSIHEEYGRLVILVSDYGTSDIDLEAIAASNSTGIRTVRQEWNRM